MQEENSFQTILPELSKLESSKISAFENQWRDRKYVPVPPTVMGDWVSYWTYLLDHKDSAENYCFQELASAVLNILCLPVSNAEVESVFIQVKILKTDLRNRLSTDTLANLLHIKFIVRGENKHDC